MEDTIFALCRGFDQKKHIHVRFVGEPAVDGGGPRREFFMLLMNAIANSGSLLQGPPNRRVLRHSTSAFQVITTVSHNLQITVLYNSIKCIICSILFFLG